VDAQSPDGGRLSYQWHVSAGEGWTAIAGATAASYASPTGEYGALHYYVRITNTNEGVSGATSAATNSEPATVTVVRVNAQPALIRTQPRNTACLPSATATLFVDAASPDGGTLTYQWHSRAGINDEWTAISGATGTSYTPPATATEGKTYYYVAITNTNNNVDGEIKTALAYSNAVTFTVTSTGTGSFSFAAWVNGDDKLIIAMPDNFDISRSSGDSIAITVADDLTDPQWSVNNKDIPPPRGAARTITIEAATYAVGNYTLGLYAKKGGIAYSINITFMVIN
jgi:hypothetical protein